jgi:hypothetical protein
MIKIIIIKGKNVIILVVWIKSFGNWYLLFPLACLYYLNAQFRIAICSGI